MPKLSNRALLALTAVVFIVVLCVASRTVLHLVIAMAGIALVALVLILLLLHYPALFVGVFAGVMALVMLTKHDWLRVRIYGKIFGLCLVVYFAPFLVVSISVLVTS